MVLQQQEINQILVNHMVQQMVNQFGEQKSQQMMNHMAAQTKKV